MFSQIYILGAKLPFITLSDMMKKWLNNNHAAEISSIYKKHLIDT